MRCTIAMTTWCFSGVVDVPLASWCEVTTSVSKSRASCSSMIFASVSAMRRDSQIPERPRRPHQSVHVWSWDDRIDASRPGSARPSTAETGPHRLNTTAALISPGPILRDANFADADAPDASVHRPAAENPARATRRTAPLRSAESDDRGVARRRTAQIRRAHRNLLWVGRGTARWGSSLEGDLCCG